VSALGVGRMNGQDCERRIASLGERSCPLVFPDGRFTVRKDPGVTSIAITEPGRQTNRACLCAFESYLVPPRMG
jgi:hypothetical protein